MILRSVRLYARLFRHVFSPCFSAFTSIDMAFKLLLNTRVVQIVAYHQVM